MTSTRELAQPSEAQQLRVVVAAKDAAIARLGYELAAKDAALTASAEREAALRTALRDLIDAIPEATVAADPPLGCWIEAGEIALGLPAQCHLEDR